jgi:hypothetical protein
MFEWKVAAIAADLMNFSAIFKCHIEWNELFKIADAEGNRVIYVRRDVSILAGNFNAGDLSIQVEQVGWWR